MKLINICWKQYPSFWVKKKASCRAIKDLYSKLYKKIYLFIQHTYVCVYEWIICMNTLYVNTLHTYIRFYVHIRSSGRIHTIGSAITWGMLVLEGGPLAYFLNDTHCSVGFHKYIYYFYFFDILKSVQDNKMPKIESVKGIT